MANNRLRTSVSFVFFLVIVGLAGRDHAQAKDEDLQELIAAVEPSIVTIEVPGIGAGSGFVVDDDGIIATCYHVIEGAREVRVRFRDGSLVDAAGFVTVSPGKDIALLKINAGQKLVELPIAPARPAKGEGAFAFGAPIGLVGSVSDGIVSAVRDGFEISRSMKDLYAALAYDMDAIWLQTTAPISHGNSGGPLVNKDGEVVGINTWSRPDAQNLNFAAAAVYVQRMLDDAGDSLHPFAELPRAKRGSIGPSVNASRATRNYWAELANRKSSLKKVDSSMHAFGLFVPALRSHVESIKSLTTKDVDPSLSEIATLEAQNVDRLATALSKNDSAAVAKESELNVRINEEYDFLRIKLSAKYGLEFPPVTSLEARQGIAEEVDPAVAAPAGLQRAKQLLERGDAAAGVSELSELIRRFPETPAAKEALALLGPAQLKYAKEMLEGGQWNRLELSAHLLRGVIEMCRGTPEATEAEELLEQVDYQRLSKQAAGKLTLCKKLIDAGKRDAAITRLKSIVAEYPGTPAAKKAAEILKRLDD